MPGPLELIVMLALAGVLGAGLLRRGSTTFLPRRQLPWAHVPARFEPGDPVVVSDGTLATFSRRAGAMSLLEVDTGGELWVRTHSLQLDERQARAAQPPQSLPPPAPRTPPPQALTDDGLFARLGQTMFERRRVVVILWVLLVAGCAPFAFSIERDLKPGGFIVQTGDAQQVMDRLGESFGMPTTSATVIVPGPFREVDDLVNAARPKLARLPHVMVVSPPRPSNDGALAAFDVGFSQLDPKAMETLPALRSLLSEAGFDEARIEIAGSGAVAADTTEQAQRDLRKAEMFGIPAAMVVLLIVFRTAVAALVPLLIGVSTTVISLALLHALALQVPLSIFVLNIAGMLALGLGIDYSLLGVTRFRGEYANGADPRRATINTLATAGRATVISGVAVAAGLAALAVLPIMAMRSIALAGVVVVAVSIAASCTLLPALLALLGDRVERGRMPAGAVSPLGQSRWYAATRAIMRRPGLWLIVGGGVLLLLALPLTGARMEVPHGDVLPPASPSQVAERTLASKFAEQVNAPMLMLLPAGSAQQAPELERQISSLPHIHSVHTRPTIDGSGAALVVARGTEQIARGGTAARATVRELRAIASDHPGVLVGGVAAGEQEFMEETRAAVPKIAAIIVVSILVIIGIGFRSVWLPLKAIVLATLSIAGAFGLTVLVFQEGIGIELLGSQALGYTDATLPLILFCLLFGLSMDYEVFILAKVTELYQAGYDEEEATARGVASTAPLVTGAALILIVIGIAFARTDLVLVQQIGFGMAAALVIDATLVRAVLLPAAMTVLGRRNWWMPVWMLRRVPPSSWTH